MSAPKNVKLHYCNAEMKKINDFLQEKGNNMIYIYGGYDPWTASAVQLIEGNTNALKMVKEKGSHRTRIHSFSISEQEQIADSLNVWLNLKDVKERLSIIQDL